MFTNIVKKHLSQQDHLLHQTSSEWHKKSQNRIVWIGTTANEFAKAGALVFKSIALAAARLLILPKTKPVL